jgi:glycyl-tRNA synthetase
MLEKSERIEKLTDKLAALLGLDASECETALRAAHLAKADLATGMVVEMTALQGVMGREYALAAGEPAEVARAIEEHYWPLGADGNLPQRLAGLTIGLADRLDSLIGLFAVGLAPTGAADPFGQRRAALGVVQLLLGRELDFDVRSGLEAAAALQPVDADASVDQAADFLARRLRGVLREHGYRPDVVEATLAAQSGNPWRAQQAAEQLSAWVSRSDWQPTLNAYARCVRILPDDVPAAAPEPNLFNSDAERELWMALQVAQSSLAATSAAPGVDDFLAAFKPTIPAITRFFDAVLVMDEDTAVRSNRLGLLHCVAVLADRIVDLSKLEGF